MSIVAAYKRFIPPQFLSAYHFILTWLAAWWYGYPSKQLIVIGVTGTNGKTTTSYLIAKALESSGKKVGCTTTALFKIGEHEWLNATKMTMLGRFQLQKLLRRMVEEGCVYAVVETSSQGIEQHRHRGIEYDVVVFTNLTPEHIEAHGGFEAYKAAKLKLFQQTAAEKRKMYAGRLLQKIAILNQDDIHAKDFALANFDRLLWFSVQPGLSNEKVLRASHVQLGARYSSFEVAEHEVRLQIPGMVNVQNALAALTVVHALEIPFDGAVRALSRVELVPGRFEYIDEGQHWTVLIDYAPEPASLEHLYEMIELLPHHRIIHVLGSAGGGRDVARRPILGRIAGSHADIVIVTNEDPYDDSPRQIIDHVADGAREVGKRDDESLFCIEDRRQAIHHAMRLAQSGDLVLLTGKGSEQAIMIQGGGRISWDEREVAREAIRSVLSRHAVA